MALLVSMGAMMTCTMGLAPSSLVVLPVGRPLTPLPAANIMDFVPFVNIPPFGMCNSIANPVVAAATAAKLGVFTPAACIPATVAPWMPGNPKVLVGNMPALGNDCKLMCLWAGMIQFTTPGQFKVQM